MQRFHQNGYSLKWGLVIIMVICWIVPVTVILLYSGYAIRSGLQERVRDTILTSADIVFQQTQDRISGAMDASRKSSYSSAISTAHRQYMNDADHVKLYDSVTSYLLEQYRYDPNFNATLLFFTMDPKTLYYVSSRTDSREIDSLRRYKSSVHESVLQAYTGMGTQIRFMQADGRLYMVRNMLDSNFRPYAVIVMECDQDALYEAIRSIVWVQSAAVEIDGGLHVVTGDANGAWAQGRDGASYDAQSGLYTIRATADVSGHTIRLSVVCDTAGLTQELPGVVNLLPLMGIFGALLFLFVLWAHYRFVARPVDALVDAAGHMEAGERGYTVRALPPIREFRYLTERFNSMSLQLKAQFERNYEEQLALQDARVKALRSQINPHFLNNTLEAISWTARMAEDTKVCRMIEALSTMLDAAMARGGRARDTVQQELTYTDAYLYILSERLGDRLRIVKHIAPETRKALVPCLILQPIVENAFEHGIALQQRGEIAIRTRIENDMLILEVENDGHMSEADRKKIARLLDWDKDADHGDTGDGSREYIGIRNVNRRLKILYGEAGELNIAQAGDNRVLARIVIPYVEYDA